MQLSVVRYKAIAVGRGANLDTIDCRLNNRMLAEGSASRRSEQCETESDRAGQDSRDRQLDQSGSGRVLRRPGRSRAAAAPGHGRGLRKGPRVPRLGADRLRRPPPRSGLARVLVQHAESLLDAPLRMHYTDLDPSAQYKIRVVYGGDMPRVPVRLVANGNVEIHPLSPEAVPRRSRVSSHSQAGDRERRRSIWNGLVRPDSAATAAAARYRKCG